MNQHVLPLLLSAVLCGAAAPACAKDEKATPEQAMAMVRKAAALIRKEGGDKAYPAITNPQGEFVQHDLYITVWGLDGTVRAHGLNRNMVGKNLIDLKDIDGKPFVRERLELARTQSAFWQEYQYTHPVTKRIEPKRMYCEKLADSVVCGGVYK